MFCKFDNLLTSANLNLSFTCFNREKGFENRGKTQDYLESCPIVNF